MNFHRISKLFICLLFQLYAVNPAIAKTYGGYVGKVRSWTLVGGQNPNCERMV